MDIGIGARQSREENPLSIPLRHGISAIQPSAFRAASQSAETCATNANTLAIGSEQVAMEGFLSGIGSPAADAEKKTLDWILGLFPFFCPMDSGKPVGAG